MAGIYIHIPFCKQACHYCNFHFSTSLGNQNAFLEALVQEIDLRKDYLKQEEVTTIYFGGGTPSLLSPEEINRIIDKVYSVFKVNNQPEITLEANPDDLTKEKVNALAVTPINRLSIGVQSFQEADLQFMNRAHSARQAVEAVERVQQAGFNNITIDLIYGTPSLEDKQWEENLEQTFAFNIPHISAYCLTVEPKTALDHFVRKGKLPDVDPEQAARQYERLMEAAEQHGYEHYEISNFARPGFRSRHNSSYWTGEKYLGLGPSAHSFDGQSRQWNVANNIKYIQSLQANALDYEVETLSENDRFNEYLMTALRTDRGIDLDYAARQFGSAKTDLLQANLPDLIADQLIIRHNDRLTLTTKGKLLADQVISELFEV